MTAPRRPAVGACGGLGASRFGVIIGLAGLGSSVLLLSYYAESTFFPRGGQVSIESLEQSVSTLQLQDEQLRKRLTDLEVLVEEQARQLAAGGGKKPKKNGPGPTKEPSAGAPGPGPPRPPTEAATAAPSLTQAAASAFLSLGQPSPTPAPAPPAEGATSRRWREDMRCGADYPDADGRPAECRGSSEMPCCGKSGWCGATSAHCTCDGCVDYRPAEGDGGAYDERSPKNIALVVPFRDREVHLQRFRDRIDSHIRAWNAKGVRHNWTVYVVEQFDNELFNRGYLFNVGFKNAMEQARRSGRSYDCVVMHDIDIIPEPVVDYGWCRWPQQLSSEIECWGWSAPYPDNVGGVVSLSPQHWQAINGFSNEYEGWGGEDDDLYLRLKQNALLKGGCHTWCKNKPRVPVVHRPPIGQGRMNCLHDGDHTPRQRASNDSAMWKRLKEMKRDSKRWQADGLSSLQVHEAAAREETAPCGNCAREGGGGRHFYEQWSRVSKVPMRAKDHLRLLAPLGLDCPGRGEALTQVPQGLDGLRQQLAELFGDCGLTREQAASANFALVDLALGQVLLVGRGAGAVLPDSSLPSLHEGRGDAERRRVREEAHNTSASYLVQSQRLLRWIRRLPPEHSALIVAFDEPLDSLRERYVKSARRVQSVSPVCISTAGFDGGKKFRLTPGTTWCGDNGWSNLDFFNVLRSSETAPPAQLVPLCVAENADSHTFRFESSEATCLGKHTSGTVWEHAQTVHTRKDARGEDICVGIISSGKNTRWTMQKARLCTGHGASHRFTFKAMTADHSPPPLVQGCLQALPGGLRHLAFGAVCAQEPPQDTSRELWLLAGREAGEDYRLCGAQGRAEGDSAMRPDLWRILLGDACDRTTLTTKDSLGKRIEWFITKDAAAFLPAAAQGERLCLCEVALPALGGSAAARGYTWQDDSCGPGGQKEFCLRFLSPADILQHAYLNEDA